MREPDQRRLIGLRDSLGVCSDQWYQNPYWDPVIGALSWNLNQLWWIGVISGPVGVFYKKTAGDFSTSFRSEWGGGYVTSPSGTVILGKILIRLWDISVIVILEFGILSSRENPPAF